MHLNTTALLLAGCLLAGCNAPSVAPGTAEPSASQQHEEPAVAPTASEPEPPLPKGPVLTPEQVWDKLLAMIDAIGRREDLNQQHIEQAIGLSLQPQPGEPHFKVAYGDTTAGWGYLFDLSQYTEDDVRMSFLPYHPDADGQGNSPTCTWRTEDLRAALRQRGFSERDETASGALYFSWRYERGPSIVRVRYYFNEQKFDFSNTCVSLVLVSFVIPEFYREPAPSLPLSAETAD